MNADARLVAGEAPAIDRNAVTLRARRVGEEAISYLESRPAYALELVTSLEAECEAAGSRIGKAWRLQVSGWRALRHDEPGPGRAAFDEAISICEAEGDAYCLVKSLNGLASAYSSLDLFDRCLDVYRRALAVARSLPDFPQLSAMIGGNIGGILHELGDPAAAAPYLEDALALGTSNPNNLAVLKGSLGLCYADLGRADEAEPLIRESVAICASHGFTVTESIMRGKLGKFFLARGKTGEALAELAEAIRLSKAVDSLSTEAECLVTQAKALLNQGRSGVARRQLRRAIRLAEETDIPVVLSSALGSLAELQARAGEWRAAYLLALRKGRIEKKVFGDQVTAQTKALKSERLEAENEALANLYRRLSTISEIGRSVAAAVDVDSVCRILHRYIADLMPAEVFGVALYLPESDELDYRYYMDAGEEVTLGLHKVDAERTLSGWCIRNGKELVLGDVAAEHGMYTKALTKEGKKKEGEVRSLIYYPVMVKDRPVAVVTVQARAYRQYEPYHVETLKALGAYMGIALENARLFEELRNLAVTDSLTGCMNRRRFMEIIETEIDRSARYAAPFSVIIFDLDRFKDVNDSHGHAAGDAVLKAIVSVSRKRLRNSDFMARYGGEEFVIGLPDTALAGAAALAERLRADLEAGSVRVEDGSDIVQTASFGVACRADGEGLDGLLGRADAALYRAKDSGRNKVMVADSRGG
jgi:diguanylate cyclase (GGDEF)-like protein